MTSSRFRISLSFAGEIRSFVEDVAKELAGQFGEEAVLYDKFHEAEFSRARLNRYLPKLYHDQTDLAVGIFSSSYPEKEWCGLEWDAIFDLIAKQKDTKVMLCRFHKVEIEGLYGAGFAELDGRSATDCARLILERLALNEGRKRDHYRAKDEKSDAGNTSCHVPVKSDPAEYERKVRDAFGPQYEHLKSILEKHPALRDALAVRYGLTGQPAPQLAPQLIAFFHEDFCASIAKFSQIYEEDRIEAPAILELVSTVLYVAMHPDYARELKVGSDPMSFSVSQDAKQGIVEMLLSWTRHKGHRTVPIKHLTDEKPPEMYETDPFQTASKIKHSLMDRLGISRDDDKALIKELSYRKGRGHPEYQAVNEADKALIAELQKAGSPLTDLLLLIKLEEQTIHPGKLRSGVTYDAQLEYNLKQLIGELRPS